MAWKAKKGRKPLILKGARQVGKTYTLKEFGKKAFPRFHYVNFESDLSLGKLFEKDLKPKRILQDLSFYLDTSIDIKRDLIIFDEIQNVKGAITSLKYFAEEMPELAICGAGSLLGLSLGESSFPVGKVDFLSLSPFSFEEFLRALSDEKSLQVLSEFKFLKPLSDFAHEHLWERLKLYFIIGGLPEAVLTYVDGQADSFEALISVRKKQADLINAYMADIAKHSGKINSMHIERLWRNIPNQLARSQDSSSSKFVFKGVIPGINGYVRLASALDWLIAAGLGYKVPIANKSWSPLSAYTEENFFKMFLFDIGILGALGNLAPKSLYDFNFGSFKGYIAEEFALQEMVHSGKEKLYSWRENTAEVEFLWEQDGQIIPIEIKSGWVTQAKSLKVYAEKYSPKTQIILSAKNFSANKKSGIYHVPLYLASRISELIK